MRWLFTAFALTLRVVASARPAPADSTASRALSGRYALMPSAMPFERGDHVAVVRLYGFETHFALSDRVRIGVQSSYLISPVGLSAHVHLTPPSSRFHLALSGRLANASYLGDFESSIAFATLHATAGTPRRHVTLTAGLGTSNVEQLYTYYSAYSDVLVSPADEDPRRDYRQQGRRRLGGAVVGLACLTPLKSKTSFLLDATYLLTPNSQYVNTFALEERPDFGTTFVYETCTIDRRPSHSFLLVTGLRFQQSPHHTFQATITGFSTPFDLPLNFIPIPLLPMATWQLTF